MNDAKWVPAVGDPIRKPKGYSFNGEVRSVFTTRSGETRIVAELIGDNGGGMCHIFSLSQLEPRAQLPGPAQ
jgi:hypothetical protein